MTEIKIATATAELMSRKDICGAAGAEVLRQVLRPRQPHKSNFDQAQR